MAAAKWTAEQKAEALRLYADVGSGEAARRTGIPQPTISSWARRNGVQSSAPANMHAANQATKIKWEQRRLTIADDFGDALRVMLAAAVAASRADDVRAASRAKDFMVAAAIAYDKAELRVGGLTGRVGIDMAEPEARLAEVHQLRDAVAKRAAAS